jgi:hypothetical protein
VTFAEALRSRAWLPAERNPERLKSYPGHRIPEDRLYRAEEIYFPHQGNLVASQKPIFRNKAPDQEIRKALSFPARVAREVVIVLFDRLIGLWEAADHSGLDQKLVETSLGEIYGYLSTFAAPQEGVGGKEKKVDGQSIRQHYQNRKCLWYGGEFWHPAHAFQIPVPFFGRRRVHIPVQGRKLVAYELLGMRKEPQFDDYQAFLSEVAAALNGKPVPEAERKNLLTVYRKLGSELPEVGSQNPRFPVLTDTFQLLSADQVLHPDAPWFKERLSPGAVNLLHQETPREVASYAAVRSLSKSIRELPAADFRPVGDQAKLNQCQGWQETIRSEEFRTGVERLARHEERVVRPRELEWLADVFVTPVEGIVTDLFLMQDGRQVKVGGGGSIDFYYQPDQYTVYLDAGAEMLDHLTNSINNELDTIKLNDSISLMRMIESPPAQIPRLLNKRRIKPLPRGTPQPQPEDREDEEPAGAGPPCSGAQEARESQSENGSSPEGYPAVGSEGTTSGETATASPDCGSPESANTTTPSQTGEAFQAQARGTGSATSAGDGRGTGQADGSKKLPPGSEEEGETPPTGKETGARTASGEQAPSGGTPEGNGSTSPAGGAGQANEPDEDHSASSTAKGGKRGAAEWDGTRARGDREKPSHQTRLVSYVVAPTGDGSDGEAMRDVLEEDDWQGLGNLGVERVAEEEKAQRSGREVKIIKPGDAGYDNPALLSDRVIVVKIMPPNHPGYDIEVWIDGIIERYIEVKAMRDAWGARGVGMTPTQFEHAQKWRDKYWLFVDFWVGDATRFGVPRKAEGRDTEYRKTSAMAGPCTAAERSLESRIPGE